jgi:C4-dicarboxylate-specific signal transduction histidine kinase
MTAELAQASADWTTSLATSGVAGAVLVFFMFRDTRREDREAKNKELHDERERERDERMDDIVTALNHLTRALTLEVLTRPNVVERARKEAQQLNEAVGDK